MKQRLESMTPVQLAFRNALTFTGISLLMLFSLVFGWYALSALFRDPGLLAQVGPGLIYVKLAFVADLLALPVIVPLTCMAWLKYAESINPLPRDDNGPGSSQPD